MRRAVPLLTLMFLALLVLSVLSSAFLGLAAGLAWAVRRVFPFDVFQSVVVGLIAVGAGAGVIVRVFTTMVSGGVSAADDDDNEEPVEYLARGAARRPEMVEVMREVAAAADRERVRSVSGRRGHRRSGTR